MNMIDNNQQPTRIFEIVMAAMPSDVPRQSAQMEIGDYREMLQYYWGSENPIKPEHVVRVIERIKGLNDEEFFDQFPSGHRCIPVVFPFADSGTTLEESELNRGDHVYILVESPEGITAGSFTSVPSQLAAKLPSVVRNNGFFIPEDRDECIMALERALDNFNKIF